MNNAASLLPTYASDTSGVCSALYELGGMTVIHDASGCNSTYSTFDEPRWYDQESMIYISGLTEMDAILGLDSRLISDCLRASEELSPSFIALAGSPMPMLLGCDLEAIAREIEATCKIPTLAIKTNGIASYVSGASRAFLAIAERFVAEAEKKSSGKIKVNLLGATPLDLDERYELPEIKAWLERAGFQLNSCLSMGADLSSVRRLGEADVNLVLASSGLACAEFLNMRFHLPFVVGKPVGLFAEILAERLTESARSGVCFPLSRKEKESHAPSPRHTLLIGESVAMASLAQALSMEEKTEDCTSILCPLEEGEKILADMDLSVEDEAVTRQLISSHLRVIADPFYRLLLPPDTDVSFLPLVHTAFSGRVYHNQIRSLISTSFSRWLSGSETC